MNDLISGSMGQAKDYLVGSIGQWIQWLANSVLQTIGWSGLVAMACGFLLLMSLSARAVKFFYSPRGMGITAAVMLMGVTISWWLWPQAASAALGRQLASNGLPKPPAEKVSPTPETVAKPPIEAMAVPPPLPVASRNSLSAVPDLPLMVFDLPPLGVVPPTNHAVVLPPKHGGQQKAPAKPHHTAAPATQPKAAVASRPATPGNRLAQRPTAAPASRPVAQPSRTAGSQASIAQNQSVRSPQAPSAAARRAFADYQFEVYMYHLYNQQSGGMGMHPMGGMGHVGGGHMGHMGRHH